MKSKRQMIEDLYRREGKKFLIKRLIVNLLTSIIISIFNVKFFEYVWDKGYDILKILGCETLAVLLSLGIIALVQEYLSNEYNKTIHFLKREVRYIKSLK